MVELLIDPSFADDAAFEAFKEVYVSELRARTPKATRQTSEAWKARRIGPFKYEVFNTKTTEDGAITIVKLLEEGTKPHKITLKPNSTAKALHWQKGTKDFFAKSVQHPGYKARQFVKAVIEDDRVFEEFTRMFLQKLGEKFDLF